jgi:predicted ATP-grasp superfamily ATP-dependent carboligase
MDKRASLRQHFQQEENQAQELEQYKQRTAQLNALEGTMVQAFNALIKYMDGKTTKTEVVNQLKSISTPDVDKVVQAVSKLDKDILSNKLDLKPVTDALNGMKRELGLIPKSLPKIPEQKDSFKVTNLDEVKLDTSEVVSAIKALKLDVKAPIINEKEVDLKPLQTIMLDLLKVVQSQKPVEIPKFPEIPVTDLTKVETKLEKSNKLLKEIVDKPVGGGGGGGGNGTPYIDSTGKPVNVELTVDGKIPVEAGATSTYELRNDTTTDANLVYLGKALPGSDVTDAAWQIKRYNKSTGHMSFADDVTAFTKVWNNRASYTY